MTKTYHQIRQKIAPLFSTAAWRTFGRYVGFGTRGGLQAIHDIDSLSLFLETRASHIAQSSLYGYLKTRAGTRFPQLFENPDLLESINIAKWQIWLACLSDLCVFVGYRLKQNDYPIDSIEQILDQALAQVLKNLGIPEDAGPHFTDAQTKVLQRIKHCNWQLNRNDDDIFCESPDALVYWAPIAHDLKHRDEEIVTNSIRFKWIEIRREARRLLDDPDQPIAVTP